MSKCTSNSERKLATSTREQAWLGSIAGEILRHAASKQAQVDDLAEHIHRLELPDRSTKSAVYAFEVYQDLTTEIAIQENKLSWRASSAENLVAASLELQLTNPQDKSIVAQGILTAIDLRRATLQLAQPDGKPLEVVYAASLPVPEDADQTYFGHVLSVDFAVLSVQPDKSWVLR